MPYRRVLLLLLWHLLSLPETVVGSTLRGFLSNNKNNGRSKKTLGNFRLVDYEESGLEASTNTDQCGLDVAMDGAIAVVGCPGADFAVGKVQVFVFENGDWKLSTTIRPTSVSPLGLFGTNVAIRNSVIVVGAYTNSVNGMVSGGAFVYEKISSIWTETASLSLENQVPGDQFGRDVAISEDGKTIVVGAALADVQDVKEAGLVDVFRKEGGKWIRKGTLVPQDPETLSGFGSSLGIYGKTVVVGAFRRTVGESNGQGEVFVFEELAESNFTLTSVLRADDGTASDAFGNAVDIHKDRIVAGAINHDANSQTDSGSVYVFDRVTDKEWKQVAKLTPDESSSLDRFGQSVAVFGDRIAVGSVAADVFEPNAGAVYVFERVDQGGFSEIAVLGSNHNQLVGISVGFSSSALIIGASGGIRGSAFVESSITLGQCVPQVTGFTALNINDGHESDIDFEVNVEKLGGLVNIRAKVDDCGQPQSFMCAKLELGSDKRLQRSEPLSLFASTGGTPNNGFGVLKACLYEDTDCEVGRKGCLDIDIVVLDCIPNIKSFILYDALSDQPLEAISNLGSMCLPPGGMINIKAVAECVENVEFAFRGADGRADNRVEATAPYFLYGDNGDDVLPQYDMQPMPPGQYALRSRYRPANSLLGQGTVLTQRFFLLDCSTAQPSSLPSAIPTSSPSEASATIAPSMTSRADERIQSTTPITPHPTRMSATKLPTPVPSSFDRPTTSPTSFSPTQALTPYPSSEPSKAVRISEPMTSSPTNAPTTIAPTTSPIRVTSSPSVGPTRTVPTSISPSLSQRTNSPTATFLTTVPSIPIVLPPDTPAPSLEPTKKAQRTVSPSSLQGTSAPTYPLSSPPTTSPVTLTPSTSPTRTKLTYAPTPPPASDAPITVSQADVLTLSPSTNSSPTPSPMVTAPSIGGITNVPVAVLPPVTHNERSATRIPTVSPTKQVQITSETSSPSKKSQTFSPTSLPSSMAPTTSPETSSPTKTTNATLAPTMSPALVQVSTLSPSTNATSSQSPTSSPMVGPPSIGGGSLFFVPGGDD